MIPKRRQFSHHTSLLIYFHITPTIHTQLTQVSVILCVIVVQGDDDAYVIVENLRYLLDQYDSGSPVYLGHLYKRFHKEGYMSGGASYVLSREALRMLVKEGIEKVRITSACTTGGVCVSCR